MDLILQILEAWGLGILAGLCYILFKVWRNFSLMEFNRRKFFNDNKWFWVLTVALNLVLVMSLIFVPEVKDLFSMFVEIDTGPGGYFVLGWALASGTNNQLVKKKVENSPLK